MGGSKIWVGFKSSYILNGYVRAVIIVVKKIYNSLTGLKTLWHNVYLDKKSLAVKPHAGIAQLVEHNLAKVGVASSSLVSRSRTLLCTDI